MAMQFSLVNGTGGNNYSVCRTVENKNWKLEYGPKTAIDIDLLKLNFVLKLSFRRRILV